MLPVYSVTYLTGSYQMSRRASLPVAMCERPRSHHLDLNLQRKGYLRVNARVVARVGKLARLDRQGRLSYSERVQRHSFHADD